MTNEDGEVQCAHSAGSPRSRGSAPGPARRWSIGRLQGKLRPKEPEQSQRNSRLPFPYLNTNPRGANLVSVLGGATELCGT